MSSKSQVVRGEVKVDLGSGVSGKVGVSQNTTLVSILEMAKTIWAEVKRAGIVVGDEKGTDDLLKTLQNEYKDFATSYPIPFRWMVQVREYEPAVFEKWLKGHVKMMYKDRKEFLDAQGEYLVILYKTRQPKIGARELNAYRAAIRKSLEKDDQSFKRAHEEAEKEVKESDRLIAAERRRRVFMFVKGLKDSQNDLH